MYFCPKCNFSLNIINNISNPFITNIENVDDFLDLVESNNMEGVIKINFSKKDMLSNKNFKNKNKEDSKELLKLYDNLSLDSSKNAFFICNNCNYHTTLNSGTIIFRTILNEDQVDDKTLVKKRTIDSTLPRTKDFICPNQKCETNKNFNDKNREAVFYRPESNNYKIKYVCCVCKLSWSPYFKLNTSK